MIQTDDALLIAGRLLLPRNIRAILWDMDGVLIDSLGFDYKICNALAAERFGPRAVIPDPFIRSIFAYHPPEFWRRILDFLEREAGIERQAADFDAILAQYERMRQSTAFDLNPGIREVLTDARAQGLRMAVVSNNPTADVRELLERGGILDDFDLVVGNDLEKMAKKPAPDAYLYAAGQLGTAPADCAVVEDSLIGIEAGFRAGCHTVAVATGSADFRDLSLSNQTHQTYAAFDPLAIDLELGDVRQKRIRSPNDFVSHMVEHIAWRLGARIDLDWNNDDWRALGAAVGGRIATLPHRKGRTAVLGMIDDGSAEVALELPASQPGARFLESPAVELPWFLGLRCEQIDSGAPLVQLLEGLALALRADIAIRLCSAEDPHHAWEGIFRAVGIALGRLWNTPETTAGAPPPAPAPANPPSPAASGDGGGRLTVLEKSFDGCHLARVTAESDLSVRVDFTRSMANGFHFEVADSIQVAPFAQLLEPLAREAGFTLQVAFAARALSSSHVVLEDVGLALGRALLEILIGRITAQGANCAGSSVQTPEDLEQEPIRLGLSVEGRKFCLFVPLNDSRADLRQKFLVGQTLLGVMRSEDLDDFVDGLAGGLSASIMVHLEHIPDPEAGWVRLFALIGRALKEAFAANPNRKGVPPGVKATLV